MSALELVLSMVSDDKMDELVEHLSPQTRQAIVQGEGEEHAEEIAGIVWHLLEEHAHTTEK